MQLGLEATKDLKFKAPNEFLRFVMLGDASQFADGDNVRHLGITPGPTDGTLVGSTRNIGDVAKDVVDLFFLGSYTVGLFVQGANDNVSGVPKDLAFLGKF